MGNGEQEICGHTGTVLNSLSILGGANFLVLQMHIYHGSTKIRIQGITMNWTLAPRLHGQY
jgi:hypothetical protein